MNIRNPSMTNYALLLKRIQSQYKNNDDIYLRLLTTTLMFTLAFSVSNDTM